MGVKDGRFSGYRCFVSGHLVVYLQKRDERMNEDDNKWIAAYMSKWTITGQPGQC